MLAKVIKVSLLALVIWSGQSTLVSAQFSDTWELLKAVKDNDVQEVRSRLNKGANVNARNADGVPALIVATDFGNVELATFLLDAGANVDARTADRAETALMRASTSGKMPVLHMLLERKAELDHEDRGGQTALMKAAQAGRKSAAGLLIEAGADFEHEDYTGKTALQYAREARSRSIVRLLEEAGARY